MDYNITLTANHQSLTAEYLPLAAESVQYLTAKVVCETEDWTGREIKALFGQGCTVHEIPVTNGEITAKQQLNLTAGDWCVWLVGNSARDGEVIPRITTNVAHISVAPTGGTEGNPFPTMPPTAEEQLRADMGNLADLTTKDKSNLVAAINEAAEGGSKDAVKYTPQILTAAQKTQARTNIGAFPAAVVPYFYKKNWEGVRYDARNAPAFSIIQEAGEDWESEGLPAYAFIKEIKFPCIKMESYMFVNGVSEAHFLDAAGVLWHCGMYVAGTGFSINYLTKASTSMVIHGKLEAQENEALKVRLAEQEVNYIQIQNRQVEIEVSGGEVDFKLVSTGIIGTNGVLFFGTFGKVFIWGVWNESKPNEIQVSLGNFTEVEQALKEVSLQTILRTWTNNELPT